MSNDLNASSNASSNEEDTIKVKSIIKKETRFSEATKKDCVHVLIEYSDGNVKWVPRSSLIIDGKTDPILLEFDNRERRKRRKAKLQTYEHFNLNSILIYRQR